MHKFMIMCPLLAACDPGWHDMPTASIEARGNAEFIAHVRTASAIWANALIPLGCPEPFSVGETGHHVSQLPHDEFVTKYGDGIWGMEYNEGFSGLDWIDGYIDVIDGLSPETTVLVLVHELGHAIGLEHWNPANGPSIMTVAVGSKLYDHDVADAACTLGCGPCD